MLWKGRRESTNVDDRRKMGGGKMVAGGGILGVLVLAVMYFLGDGNLGDLGNMLPGNPAQQTTAMSESEAAREDELASFVKVVLADTEDVWDNLFAQQGHVYQKPTLVLFSGSTQSACGFASAASGPFYCPGDNDIYIDLSFADELRRRFNAPGEFALAYVVAHEVGHHIQNLLGKTDEMQRLRQQLSETEYNKHSVRLELQADFLAGVWAHHAHKMKDILVKEDIESALQAAAAIGDDNLQRQATGTVQPEKFTHGTSEQRMRSFMRGFETGDLSQLESFYSTF